MRLDPLVVMAASALGACDPVWRLSVEVRSPDGVPLAGAALVLTGCPRQNEHDLGTVATLTTDDGTAEVGGTGTEYPTCTVTVAVPRYRVWQTTFDELCGGARADCERSQHRVVILEPITPATGAATTLIASEADPPYPVPSPAVPCASSTAPPPTSRDKIYDFAVVPIPPVRFGPRFRDMPNLDRPRSPTPILASITSRVPQLEACYAWARFARHDLDVTTTAHLTIGESGTATVTVDPIPRAEALALCARNALGTVSVREVVARKTRVTLPIHFRPSDRPPPSRRPSRPDAPRRGPTAQACVTATGDVPTDEVVAPELVIDDGARVFGVPPLRPPTGDYDKRMIRLYVHHNDGVLRPCFADALTRKPEQEGQVTIQGWIYPDGVLRDVGVAASTTSDPTLDECVRSAIAELRFPRAADGPRVHFQIPFAPAPAKPVPALPASDTVPHVEAAAAGALEAGDGATALRRYAALVAHAPTCEHRLGLLRAQLAVAPWIDDRVLHAADDLIATRPAAACLREAAPLLLGLPARLHGMGAKLPRDGDVELAIQRYRALLTIPGFPEPDRIQRLIATALRNLGRRDEANALVGADTDPESPPPF